jgi:hypothetical protein
VIPIGSLLKMDTPPDYFSDGNLVRTQSEVVEECHLFDTSFLVWGGLFSPPTEIEKVLIPLILFSLKDLENHLLQSREFAWIVGNILTMF